MPQAIWPIAQPAADYGFGSTPSASTGLASFFQQPDIGSDIGERLGLIGEILSRTGSGRGLAGIGSELGALNQRSQARTLRAKQMTMVNRAADKIEGSNPEMAAVMRADPAFGMQLLGKKYEQQWQTDADIAKFKLMSPLELDKATQIAKINNQYELAGKLEQLKLERQYNQEDTSAMAKAMGFGGTTDAGTTAAADTSTAAAIPAPTPIPVATTPPGMGAGSGAEPAPTQQPVVQPPPIVQDTAQTPSPTATSLPRKRVIPDSELSLSADPAKAQAQRVASQIFQWPVLESEMNLIAAARTPADLKSAYARIQDRVNAEKNIKLQQDAAEQAKIREENRARDEANKRQQDYLQTVPPVSAHRGPAGRGQIPIWETQPTAPSPQDAAILRERGLNDRQIADLGATADPQARRVLSAFRAGGQAPEAATAGIIDDLTKRQGAGTAAATLAAQAGKAQQGTDALRATIVPTSHGYTPEQRQQLAALDSIDAMDPKDQGPALDNFRRTNQQASAADVQAGFEERKVGVQEAQQALAERTTAEARAAKDQSTTDEQRLVLKKTFDALDTLKESIPLLNDPKGGPISGISGYLESFRPGSTRAQLDMLAGNIQQMVASKELLGLRKIAVNGSSGLGNTNQTDLELLMNSVADYQHAIHQSPKLAAHAAKKLYNDFANTIMPDGGERMNVEDENDFSTRLFDMKRDNPAEWVIQQQYKKKNAIVTDQGSITEN